MWLQARAYHEFRVTVNPLPSRLTRVQTVWVHPVMRGNSCVSPRDSNLPTRTNSSDVGVGVEMTRARWEGQGWREDDWHERFILVARFRVSDSDCCPRSVSEMDDALSSDHKSLGTRSLRPVLTVGINTVVLRSSASRRDRGYGNGRWGCWWEDVGVHQQSGDVEGGGDSWTVG